MDNNKYYSYRLLFCHKKTCVPDLSLCLHPSSHKIINTTQSFKALGEAHPDLSTKNKGYNGLQGKVKFRGAQIDRWPIGNRQVKLAQSVIGQFARLVTFKKSENRNPPKWAIGAALVEFAGLMKLLPLQPDVG